MKVLIVGSGGREHAIAWSVSKSPKVDKIYCAPGNAGIAELAECVDIGAMEFEKLADFAQEKEIDLTIIGMDDPLVGGVIRFNFHCFLKNNRTGICASINEMYRSACNTNPSC